MSFNPYQPNYGNQYLQNPYFSPYSNPQQRLQALEQQFPQYGQTVQPIQAGQSQQQPQSQSQNPIMSVTSEQQARDYPLDLSGAPMIFVMNDDSKIFAKRFNVSNALPEFEVYEKVPQGTPTSNTTNPVQDNSLLLGIVGDFSNKLENMFTEIQALRKDVQSGNKPNGDSKSTGKQKPANATDNGASSADGTGGK